MGGHDGGVILSLVRTCSILAARLIGVPFERLPFVDCEGAAEGVKGLNRAVFRDPKGDGFVVGFGTEELVTGFDPKGVKGEVFCDAKGEELEARFGAGFGALEFVVGLGTKGLTVDVFCDANGDVVMVVGAETSFDDFDAKGFVAGLEAKGLNGAALGEPNGDEDAMVLDVAEFVVGFGAKGLKGKYSLILMTLHLSAREDLWRGLTRMDCMEGCSVIQMAMRLL